ncbi:hypothetical protein vBYenSP400_33 [Yersinia phage vB_YenS_P400]|nr:hypothetical protein vBYenSP400_33 [Yersinia phage vB_YenS_P400]
MMAGVRLFVAWFLYFLTREKLTLHVVSCHPRKNLTLWKRQSLTEKMLNVDLQGIMMRCLAVSFPL